MKVGFLYFTKTAQRYGGGAARTNAVKTFLSNMGVQLVDFELPDPSSIQANGKSTLFSYTNFKSLLKRTIKGNKFSLIQAISENHSMRRIQDYIQSICNYLLSYSNTVDFIHADHAFLAYACSKTKKITRTPYIFDLHGVSFEEAKGRNESESMVALWRKVESEAVKNADSVIAVSHPMADYIKEYYGKPAEQIIVAPNGTESYDGKASYERPLKIIYGGSFCYFEKVLDFVKTAEILRNTDYQFFLMGDGPQRGEIFDYINGNLIEVVYLGKRPKEKTLKLFSEMQIAIAPSTKDIVRQAASPVKIFDYAACSLPIITPNVGEWSKLIDKYDCGIVTENSNPHEFADAIEVLQNEKVWRQKSENSRQMIREACLWSKVLQPLGEYYSDLDQHYDRTR